MHRNGLLNDLSFHIETWASGSLPYAGFDAAEERKIVEVFTDFVRQHPGCFEREEAAGHITGSALVVSLDLQKVLLTLHGKLGLWLQLGGHADGEPAVHLTAMREAEEESGLKTLSFLTYEHILGDTAANSGTAMPPRPFDFDCHEIPARKTEPAHLHLDVRYLIIGDPQEALGITEESQDLRWFTLPEAREKTNERSMHRQFDKLEWLRTQLAR